MLSSIVSYSSLKIYRDHSKSISEETESALPWNKLYPYDAQRVNHLSSSNSTQVPDIVILFTLKKKEKWWWWWSEEDDAETAIIGDIMPVVIANTHSTYRIRRAIPQKYVSYTDTQIIARDPNKFHVSMERDLTAHPHDYDITYEICVEHISSTGVAITSLNIAYGWKHNPTTSIFGRFTVKPLSAEIIAKLKEPPCWSSDFARGMDAIC